MSGRSGTAFGFRLRKVLIATGLVTLLAGGSTPVGAAAAATTTTPVTVPVSNGAPEDPNADCVVINEINNRGGSTNSPHQRYVELFNQCAHAVDISDWSIQGYQSSGDPYSGSGQQLSGSIDPESHYLIIGSGNDHDELAHDHDAGGVLNHPGSSSSVALFSTAAPAADVAGDVSDHSDVIDSVGWGSTEIYQGEPADAADNPNTLHRVSNAGSNAEDFAADAASPMYSGGTATTSEELAVPEGARHSEDIDDVVDILGYGDAYLWAGANPAAGLQESTDVLAVSRTSELDGPSANNPEDFSLTEEFVATSSSGEDLAGVRDEDGGDPGDGGEAETVEIDQIPRETGEANELLGETVTVRAVVTAAYPTGGFDGFMIQTEGTGGDIDLATHEGSDGIFVYSPQEADGVEIGDFVEVSADVDEHSGQIQLNLDTRSSGPAGHQIQILDDEAFEEVKPAVLDEFPEDPEQRQDLQHMLIDPQGTWTVTDNYTLNQYGEVGIVSGQDPLPNPTSVVNPGAEAQALAAENAQRVIYLDDGSSANWQFGNDNVHHRLPYVYPDAPARVGADVAWETNVVLDYRFDQWRFQPRGHYNVDTGSEAARPATFENTRAAASERQGDIRLAGFNVLNYFVSLGEDEPDCDYYADRHGEPTTADSCDVRGAYTPESFQRQQDKIVSAILGMDADVIALQEIENSRHFFDDGGRDHALANLVEAVNAADASSGTWAYGDSPEATPSAEAEDMIRNGFIYRTDRVEPVGDAYILFDEGVADLDQDHFADLDLAEIYSNAREPLAQQFEPVEGGEDRFIAIVNHFKSKGSPPEDGGPNDETGDGQGAWNADRIEQARGLAAFSDALVDRTGTEEVYLMGDLNSYEQEDPIRLLEDEGFRNISGELGQWSYQFDGRVGSLDHIMVTDDAAETVVNTEIWSINAAEPIALEYSRYNGTASELYAPDQWRASDHDPIITDISLGGDDGGPPAPTDPDETETPAGPTDGPTEDPAGPPSSDPTEDPTQAPTGQPTDDSAAAETGGPRSDRADATPQSGDDATGGPGASPGGAGQLAQTGATIGGIVLGALLLLGVGGLLILRIGGKAAD